jgi:hypothetical protein
MKPTAIDGLRGYALAGLAGMLCACASAPSQYIVEKLDPVTGSTAGVLAAPVQLVTTRNRGSGRDPFAALAPFEIDRMGKREMFLWVAAPEDNGVPASVRVLCNDQPLAVTAAHLNMQQHGLTRAPYARSAPWNGEWYFDLPSEALQCLASAHRVSVIAQLADGTQDEFTADASELRGMAAFAMRYAQP